MVEVREACSHMPYVGTSENFNNPVSVSLHNYGFCIAMVKKLSCVV